MRICGSGGGREGNWRERERRKIGKRGLGLGLGNWDARVGGIGVAGCFLWLNLPYFFIFFYNFLYHILFYVERKYVSVYIDCWYHEYRGVRGGFIFIFYTRFENDRRLGGSSFSFFLSFFLSLGVHNCGMRILGRLFHGWLGGDLHLIWLFIDR